MLPFDGRDRLILVPTYWTWHRLTALIPYTTLMDEAFMWSTHTIGVGTYFV